jgi:hypothetical protein
MSLAIQDEQGVEPKDNVVSIATALANQHPIHGAFGRVFERLGGEEFLYNWGLENPTKFIMLMTKMTPSMAPTQGLQGNVNLHVHASLMPTELDVVSDQ